MQKYRVMIQGRNLLKEIDGMRGRYGFYTNVFVEAFTRADAESRAIKLLHEDAYLRNTVLNSKDDPLRFSAVEVHEIESFDDIRAPRQGLALYPEEFDGTNEN